MPPTTPEQWEERYQSGDLPWDSGLVSQQLQLVLEQEITASGRALELGCGTGTNAVYLAEKGFEVTGVDLSPTALDHARRLADERGADVEFVEVDIAAHPGIGRPFDFVFDRGCYHCVRQEDLAAYQNLLVQATQPGSRVLILAGNANEQNDDQGPPRVTEAEMRAELGTDFTIDFLREFRFEDRGGTPGPLGWSCLLTRRA